MKIKPQPKLMIFDMDGTLLDSEPLSKESMIYACNELGVTITDQIFEKIIGHNLASARRVFRHAFGADFDFDQVIEIQRMYVHKHVDVHGVPVKPGAVALLDRLDALGIAYCLATSTARTLAMYKMKAAGLVYRFPHMVCGDEVKNSKPDPEIFLKAAASCGTDPQDCVVFEDSEAGSIAAIAAKMRLIIVPDLCLLSDSTKAAAYAVCDGFNDVLKLLSP